MTLRRRNTFPGLDPRATRELLAFQDELIEELRALRSEAIGNTTDTKQSAYAARYNERIRVSAPAAGLNLTFPASSPLTQNRWIEVLKIGGGDVRITATAGQVQGVTTHTLTVDGFYYYQSDGAGGWWIQPSSGGGGGGESLAATLLIGNTTGGTDISVSATDRLIFNGGGGAPDIQGTASLTCTAATTLTCTGGTGLSLVATTGSAAMQATAGVASIVGSTGVLTASVAGNCTTQVGGANSFRVLTNAVERLEILGTGEWQVSNAAGALGNVITHQGPGNPPLWAAPAAGGALTLLSTEVNLGGVPTLSGSFTIAGAGMTVGKPVLIQQAVGPYTGKGTLADEAEDQVSVSASVTSAVLITAYWNAVGSPIVGNVKFNYAVSA